MLRSLVIGALAVVGTVSVSTAAVGAAPVFSVGSSVTVSGAVTDPATYSLEALDALPQVSVASTRAPGTSVAGVSLQTLVTKGSPRLDAGKNPLLRVAVTVRGIGRAVTFTLGELDAGFGDHPAVLTSATSGSATTRADLVVPGDRTAARSVFGVSRVEVSLTPPGPVTASAGGVDVVEGNRTVTVPSTVLARLPQHRETVSFNASGVTTSRTFVGPDLAVALGAVGVFPPAFTSVLTVTGTDSYAADVTLGEAFFGGRPLLLALSENGTRLPHPRLVTVGDKKGGRYVTDTTSVTARTT
ncbi:hypothetical protein [Williamsia sterculiae]|uniref:Uncharacterized protein n=1 Tax=Williamsia sterculiae TaxID=1344003 RepID=A0A1N7F6W9_9NOCA|nr:hypothetical protein [Williamsia sterculiae]SIR96049.1 hypothetical protein SAMN05445060_1877 [Williamsia sterculiae]